MDSKCICSTSSVSNISSISSVSNLLGVPMKYNKFISSTVLNLLVKHLSVSMPEGYQMYQEKSSVTRSTKCIMVFFIE